jgi:hypothetical protein
VPISYRIDEARKRIYTRGDGLVDYETLRAHMFSEAGEPAASYSELIDFSGATTNLTSEDVRLLASARRAIAQKQPPGPVAMVATDKMFFGMMRMYYMLTDQVRPLRVFGDVQEAERWLDEFVGAPDTDSNA